MITVRPPESGDASGLARAWNDAREFYSALDSRLFLPPDRADAELGRVLVDRLIAATNQSKRLVRVANHGDEAVGLITATLHEAVDDPNRELTRDLSQPYVTIDALAVQRSKWRRGVGTALVETVETWANDSGAPLVKVTTYSASPVSTAFYEESGYSQRAIVFEKLLNRQPD